MNKQLYAVNIGAGLDCSEHGMFWATSAMDAIYQAMVQCKDTRMETRLCVDVKQIVDRRVGKRDRRGDAS